MMTNLMSMVGVSDEGEEDGTKAVGSKTKNNRFHTTPLALHMDEHKEVLCTPKRSTVGKTNEEKEYSPSLPHFDYPVSLLDFLIQPQAFFSRLTLMRK